MEILNQTPVYDVVFAISFAWTLIGLIPFALGVIISLICRDSEWIGIGTLVGLLVMVVMLFVCIETKQEVKTDRFEYEVLLNESYSAEKLYKEYDIINVRGKIWTIRDKDVNVE